MQKKSNIKTRLIASCLALLMMLSALVGTTFAWFTDSVTSSGNKIVSGTLKVDLELLDKDTGKWASIKESKAPIFYYENWEPGYVDVKVLKVENEGSLALKWKAKFVSDVALSELANVIDVYVCPSKTELTYPADRSLAGYTKVGTVAEFVNTIEETTYGNLLAGEVAYLGIALKMQESAGNEYQNKALGAFDIQIVATQMAYEGDSFGKDYDDKAEWPADVNVRNSASVSVTMNADNTLAADAGMTSADGKVSASLVAGTKLNAGTTEVKLIITDLEESKANIVLNENEAKLSLDVHVEGVAPDNETVIKVYMAEALPKGLNMGNYKLYHVENSSTVEMTYLADGVAVDHNTFDYDPATGDVILYMATFSEVAMVAEPAKWEGKFDYSWYTNAVAPVDGEGKVDYVIANADQLAGFGAIVGGMNGQTQDSFAGKTVKLIADINLGDKESENNPDIIFYPIGYYNSEGTYERTNTAITSGLKNFEGTFDGNGNTISNFYQNTWEMKGDHDWYSPEEQYYRDGMGLFGRVYGGTVKNLTVKNFSSDGEIATTGTIAAYAEGATFENIAIFNCNPRVYNIGNGGIVGCVGWYAKEADLKTTFKNITVDNSNKISALWGSYDVACGGIVGQYYPTSGQTSAGTPANGGIHFENCHVSAVMDVYNDVCANYQYYAYRYTGMLIGSVRENVTLNGHVYPKMDGISAEDCTVHFGTWNDYYYCEIIDNTTASYTHDYQMSRLVEIKAIDGTTITYLDGTTSTVPASGRANYVIVDYTKGHGTENATCYHFKDGAVWTHDMGGIQTGVDENGDGQDDLKEDKQHIYLEFNNLVTGYGWGVTSRGFSNLDGVTNLDIAQGDQEASVEKFEKADNAPTDYRPGEVITIGDLFKVKGNAVINGNSVYVSVSPVTTGDKVSATFVLDEEDWTKSTITFAADSNGTAKVTITDYIFCTATTIYLNEEDAVEKFAANSVSEQNAYTQITLGTLFGVKGGATVGNVTATVTDPNGTETTVTGTSADWVAQTIDLIKEGTWKASIVDDDKYCAATETTFTVSRVDKFTKKFDKDFLYRVGNQNTVALGSLFSEVETTVKLSSVNVSITNVAGDAAGTFTSNATWTNGTIQFTGTGVVTVTISADGANSVSLQLEVVDATNLTSATGTITGGNFVLLQNVNTSNYVNYWNCTLYGNGFTYSLNGAPTAYNSKQGHGILITKNATLDNLVIVGDVYNSYGAYTNQDYYNAAVDVAGDTTIQNCYISGCAAPVLARESVTVVDTTLYGGTVGNLIIKGGTVTLEDVSTANYDDGRELIGMGIVVHSDTTNAKLVLNGTLTQYNFISESKVPSDTYAKNLHTAMFGTSCSDYHFGTSPNRYVNTGIISLTTAFSAADIVDNANTGYQGQSVSTSGFNGYVYTQLNSVGSVNNNYIIANDPHYASVQGYIEPENNFDHNVNYEEVTVGSNNSCSYNADSQKVLISFDQGESKVYNPNILTLTKYGETVNYAVTMNGQDYTSQNITFTTTGEYTLVYTYNDIYNYYLDNGELKTKTVSYVKYLYVSVTAVAPTIKAPEFNFYGYSSKSTTPETTITTIQQVTIDGKVYVMPASGDNIVSTTISGTTINCPVVVVDFKDNSSDFNWLYPVFLGVKITDNGTPIVDKTTTSKPDSINILTADKPTGGGGWSSGSGNSGSEGAIASGTYKNLYGWTSGSIGSDKTEDIIYGQFSYEATNGTVYYYVIAFKRPAHTCPSCVTPDTLVTLADGTQVRVDSLTGNEELLVWNMETGKLDKAPIMFIDSEAEAEYEIIHLYFSDGTEVKVIYEHGFWDYDLNKYVYLDRDAEKYIGHTFAKQNGDALEKVTLVDVVIETEVTTAWSPVTAGHLCYFVNGMLSMPGGVGGLFNIFEVDAETMTYDYEAMQKDIETYGLYTYEELNAICPLSEEMFNAAGGAYLKISIGKGNLTEEELIYMINRYSKFFA